jgi:hypothetical protein
MWYLKLEGQKTWCQELQGGVSNLILNLNAYVHNTSTQKKCTTKWTPWCKAIIEWLNIKSKQIGNWT